MDSRRLQKLEKPIGGRFLLVLFLMGIAGPALAQESAATPAALTEQEAVRRALERDELVGLWQAQVQTAEARALTEGAWPNTELAYEREQTFEDAATVSEDFVLLEQALPISGRRGLLADAARTQAEVLRHELRARRREVASQVRKTFYRTLASQERVEARGQWLERMRAVEQSLVERVAAGDSAPYELERLRKELADIEASIQTDRARLEKHRAELSGLLGLTGESAGSIAASGEILPDAVPSADELRASIESRPEVAAASRRVEAARLREQAAGRWWVPEPTLLGGYKGANVGDERFHGFVIGVGVSLPIFNQREGERMAARAAVVRAKSRKQLVEQRLTAEVLGLAKQARRLREAAQTYRTEGVERAKGLVETARKAYEAGEVGILELVDAYRGAVASELRLLEIASEARARRIELQQGLESTEVPSE